MSPASPSARLVSPGARGPHPRQPPWCVPGRALRSRRCVADAKRCAGGRTRRCGSACMHLPGPHKRSCAHAGTARIGARTRDLRVTTQLYPCTATPQLSLISHLRPPAHSALMSGRSLYVSPASRRCLLHSVTVSLTHTSDTHMQPASARRRSPLPLPCYIYRHLTAILLGPLRGRRGLGAGPERFAAFNAHVPA